MILVTSLYKLLFIQTCKTDYTRVKFLVCGNDDIVTNGLTLLTPVVLL